MTSAPYENAAADHTPANTEHAPAANVTNSAAETGDNAAASSATNSARPTRRATRLLAGLATLTGLLGFLLAGLSAVLPVNQDVTTVTWSQKEQPQGVTVPLVSYIPQQLRVTYPCQSLADAPDGVLFGTIPSSSVDAGKEGLQITRATRNGTTTLSVISKARLLLSIPVSALATQPASCQLHVDVNPVRPENSTPPVAAYFTGDTFGQLSDSAREELITGEFWTDSTGRPQVVGFFTPLSDAASTYSRAGDEAAEADETVGTTGAAGTAGTTGTAGATATMVVDTRFTTTPTPLKIGLMVIGVFMALLSLVALWRIDRRTRELRLETPRCETLPRNTQPADTPRTDTTGTGTTDTQRRRWWNGPLPTDITVTFLLVIWHFFGANTSDDGYLLNMARAAGPSGYISNYYRWLGSPESPIGWYYYLLQELTHISTASPFIRIPTLLAGIASWFIISHSLLSRFGRALRDNGFAYWTSGMLFLACWMPLCNGLRPEPIEAVLFIACWALVERAIANRTLLPGAFAIIAAAFAVGAGPTGIMCMAILLAGFRNYWQNIRLAIHQLRQDGSSRGLALCAIISPLLAAGFLILYTVFADQTLAAMREAIRVRTEIGPNLGWFEDKARWIALFSVTPDGSVTRRFPIFIMLLLIGVMLWVIARRRPVPGLNSAVLIRTAGISIGSLLLLCLTPTKWTHHFGTFLGIVAVVGAVGAVLTTNIAIARARNRWLAASAIIVTTALAFTANNDWWYVSQFGIHTKFRDQDFPSLFGKALSTWLLLLALVCLLVAALLHFFPSIQARLRERRWTQHTTRWIASKPLALALVSTGVVFFSLVSLLGAFVSRYPSYTVGASNLNALKGHPCGLANDVLVEENPGRWILTPEGASLPNGAANEAETERASTLTNPDGSAEWTSRGFTRNGVPASIDDNQTEPYTGNVVKTPDRQNRRIPPFGLPTNVPIWGSYATGPQTTARLETGWYQLPAPRPNSPLIVLTIAGNLPAQAVEVQWKDTTHPGAGGTVTPRDPGPTPSWRNLRLVRGEDIPTTATALKVVVTDTDLAPDKWIAVSPPRAPQLRTLNQVVGTTAPTLIDWSVGLAFPCQRPFSHHDGIAQQPRWRILPNAINAESANSWQDRFGGGPLGWTDLLYYAQTVPTYLRGDWTQDWGSLQRFIPRDPNAGQPYVTTVRERHSGLYSPGRMRDTPPAPKHT